MSKNKENDLVWEFNFRNFDQKIQLFSVNHADCGGAPYIDNRGRCWHHNIGFGPQGDKESPTYTPRKYLLKIEEWWGIIGDVISEAIDVAIAVVSEGEDIEDAAIDVLNITGDIEDLKEHHIFDDVNNLSKKMESLFSQACKSINRTPDEVKTIAKKMGLTSYGFIAGDSYQQLIHDNSNVMDGHGWTVLRTDVTNHREKYKANAVFIVREKLIYYWNSKDSDGFWFEK